MSVNHLLPIYNSKDTRHISKLYFGGLFYFGKKEYIITYIDQNVVKLVLKKNHQSQPCVIIALKIASIILIFGVVVAAVYKIIEIRSLSKRKVEIIKNSSCSMSSSVCSIAPQKASSVVTSSSLAPSSSCESRDSDESDDDDMSATLKQCNIDLLPDEVQLLAFSYLSAPDLASLQCVASTPKRVASDPTLWQQLYRRDFGKKLYKEQKDLHSQYAEINWEDLYKENANVNNNLQLHHYKKKIVRLLDKDAIRHLALCKDVLHYRSGNNFRSFNLKSGQSTRVSSFQKKIKSIKSSGDQLFYITKKEIHVRNNHSGISYQIAKSKPCNDLAITKDKVFALSSESSIRVADRTDGKELQILQGHSLSIKHLATNGKKVCSAAGNEICIWEEKTGNLLNSFHAPSLIDRLTISKDVVIAGVKNRIYIWDLDSGQLTQTIHAKHLFGIKVVEDNLFWVSTKSSDTMLQVRKLGTENSITIHSTSGYGKIKFLVAQGMIFILCQRKIRVLDLKTYLPKYDLAIPENSRYIKYENKKLICLYETFSNSKLKKTSLVIWDFNP